MDGSLPPTHKHNVHTYIGVFSFLSRIGFSVPIACRCHLGFANSRSRTEEDSEKLCCVLMAPTEIRNPCECATATRVAGSLSVSLRWSTWRTWSEKDTQYLVHGSSMPTVVVVYGSHQPNVNNPGISRGVTNLYFFIFFYFLFFIFFSSPGGWEN